MVEEVRAICRIENSLVRNLRITECYHRLSTSIAQRVGPGARLVHVRDISLRDGSDTPRLWQALFGTVYSIRGLCWMDREACPHAL